MTRWSTFLVALLSVMLVGCSTHSKRLMEPRNLFHQGQMDECRLRLEKLAKSHRTDRDVMKLDMAMVDLVSGRPKQAEQLLREVRDRFEHLEQDSLAEKTLSVWTDDQQRAYAGEDYEKILVYAFLTLANLMHDGGDAESYSLQLNDKQAMLAERAIERLGPQAIDQYSQVPIGHYVRGMLREASHRDYDDAIQSYQRVCELCPHSKAFLWDFERARAGVHSSPGTGVLYVFALVGRGPSKVEVTEEPTSDALLIADRIVSVVGPYSVPPTLAPIKIPDIQLPPIEVDRIGISVNGQTIGPTESVTSVESLALSTYAANRPNIVARAVARRVIKKASIVAAKTTMSKDNGLTSLAMDAAGVVWEATESADTRCWGLLPRDIQVLRVELPIGTHQVNLSPLLAARQIGPTTSTSIEIVDGRNSYLMCCFPDGKPIGQIMTGPR
jgi:tetratricopeptide (TPR) repeat protein